MSKPITRAISVLKLLRRIDVVPPQYVAEVDSTITALTIEDARTRLDPSKRKRKPAKTAARPRLVYMNDAEAIDTDQDGVRRTRKSARKPARKPGKRPAKRPRSR